MHTAGRLVLGSTSPLSWELQDSVPRISGLSRAAGVGLFRLIRFESSAAEVHRADNSCGLVVMARRCCDSYTDSSGGTICSQPEDAICECVLHSARHWWTDDGLTKSPTLIKALDGCVQ